MEIDGTDFLKDQRHKESVISGGQDASGVGAPLTIIGSTARIADPKEDHNRVN